MIIIVAFCVIMCLLSAIAIAIINTIGEIPSNSNTNNIVAFILMLMVFAGYLFLTILSYNLCMGIIESIKLQI